MATVWHPRLLDGLSVYQDVVIHNQVVCRGVRRSEDRWELIRPCVPTQGTVLDVGSNFGWFGRAVCLEQSGAVVASFEADLRSAQVQRAVLASHASRRIALLTKPFCPAVVDRLGRSGQTFKLALLLSVLHWMRHPDQVLARLGAICESFVIEFPAVDEEGAGLSESRRAVQDAEAFLDACLPNRPRRLLGTVDSHLHGALRRQLWWVGPDPARPLAAAPGLALAGLWGADLSWPPRPWWQAEFAATEDANSKPHEGSSPPPGAQWWLAPPGVIRLAPGSESAAVHRRAIARLPDDALLPRPVLAWRKARRWAGDAWRVASGPVIRLAQSAEACMRSTRSASRKKRSPVIHG